MSSGSSRPAGSTWRRRMAVGLPWTRPGSPSSATSTRGRSWPAGTKRRSTPTRRTAMTSLQHFEEQKSLGQLASAVRRRLKEFDADDIVSRIWSHDHTVWKPDPTEITNRLGWLTLPADPRGGIPRLQACARPVAGGGVYPAVQV